LTFQLASRTVSCNFLAAIQNLLVICQNISQNLSERASNLSLLSISSRSPQPEPTPSPASKTATRSVTSNNAAPVKQSPERQAVTEPPSFNILNISRHQYEIFPCCCFAQTTLARRVMWGRCQICSSFNLCPCRLVVLHVSHNDDPSYAFP
jgi:hypothetical protein